MERIDRNRGTYVLKVRVIIFFKKKVKVVSVIVNRDLVNVGFLACRV